MAENPNEGVGRGRTNEESEIARNFCLGMKVLCAKVAWGKMKPWIESRVAEEAEETDNANATQEAIAFHLRLSQGAISKFGNGGMSFSNVVAVLTDTDRTYGDLPLPNRRLRFMAGYQDAVKFVRGRLLDRIDEDKVISLVEFISVCTFRVELLDEENLSRDLSNTWTDEARAAAATRARTEAATKLGVPVEQVPYSKFEDFEELEREWGREISPCLQAIPYSWLDWARDDADG